MSDQEQDQAPPPVIVGGPQGPPVGPPTEPQRWLELLAERRGRGLL